MKNSDQGTDTRKGVIVLAEPPFFTPLTNEQTIIGLLTSTKYGVERAMVIVAGWRTLATELGWIGPVAWLVRAGFTLKQHAPKAGKCYEDFGYLQGWSLQNDEPTKDSVVFWVPRLVAGRTNKGVAEKMTLLGEIRTRFGLPKHHLSGFGSAALLAGLILSHKGNTSERVLLNDCGVCTDTLLADGRRLSLGDHGVDGLSCDVWLWDDVYRGVSLGCFPLGVEEL